MATTIGYIEQCKEIWEGGGKEGRWRKGGEEGEGGEKWEERGKKGEG